MWPRQDKAVHRLVRHRQVGIHAGEADGVDRIAHGIWVQHRVVVVDERGAYKTPHLYFYWYFFLYVIFIIFIIFTPYASFFPAS
jgi:hypothetical protein